MYGFFLVPGCITLPVTMKSPAFSDQNANAYAGRLGRMR